MVSHRVWRFLFSIIMCVVALWSFQSQGFTQEILDAGLVDSDHDGVTDDRDNCLNQANWNQLDTDGDDVGDVCDGDDDGDDILDGADAFPLDSSR